MPTTKKLTPKPPAKPRKLARMWLCRERNAITGDVYLIVVGQKPTVTATIGGDVICERRNHRDYVDCWNAKGLHRVLPAKYRLKPGGGPIEIRFAE